MNRQNFLLLLALLGFQSGPTNAAALRPNIFVFLTDDQSQLDCTPYDGMDIRTPNMQRLAAAILKRYHARPAEELYDLASDPHEQRNLAADPKCTGQLAALRAEVDAWMKASGDQQQVPVEPRLLSDPNSYGPKAAITDQAKPAPKKKAKQ